MSRFVSIATLLALFALASTAMTQVEACSPINQLRVVNGGAMTVAPEKPATVMNNESKDLKQLKKGKWIVVNVQRDGSTIPAQFGQKVGDVITFETQDDSTIFG